MEYVNEFINWFWQLKTDALITTWGKANMIITGIIVAIISIKVKQTKTTADDEVLAAIKRRLGLGE